jgi:hypothetical protein
MSGRSSAPDRSAEVLEQLADGVRPTLPERGAEPNSGGSAQVSSTPPPRALPLATLVERAPRTGAFHAVTTIDSRGRLADRSPLRALGWPPLSRVSINSINGELIVVRRCDGPDSVTSQGHLRLPARVRHVCRLERGERLLVAAFPACDLLTVYTGSALDAMLRAYHRALLDESRIS